MEQIPHLLFPDTLIPAPVEGWHKRRWGYALHQCMNNECLAPHPSTFIPKGGLILGFIACPVCGGIAQLTNLAQPGHRKPLPVGLLPPASEWVLPNEEELASIKNRSEGDGGNYIMDFVREGGLTMRLRSEEEPGIGGEIKIFWNGIPKPEWDKLTAQVNLLV